MRCFFIALLLFTCTFGKSFCQGRVTYADSAGEKYLKLHIPQRVAASKNGDADWKTPYPAIILTVDTTNANKIDNSIISTALSYGYAVAELEYDQSLEQAMKELVSSIKLLKENGKRYGIDPGKIILWGYSDGGYLAATAGCAGTYLQGFESEMEFGSSSQMAQAQKNEQKLQKYVNSIGIYSSGNGYKVQAVVDLFGPFTTQENGISPQILVTPQSPPFFMIYKQSETGHDSDSADAFSSQLKSAIGSQFVEYILLPQTLDEKIIFENPQFFRQIFVFLDKILFH